MLEDRALSVAIMTADLGRVPFALAAAHLAGARPLSPLPLDAAQLSSGIFTSDVQLADLRGGADDMLWALLEQLREADQAGLLRIIALIDVAQIDLVAEGLFGTASLILCAPELDDIAQAILEMSASRSQALHDSGGARARQLEAIQYDVERISRTLRELTAVSEPAPPTSLTIDPIIVRKEIEGRRLRERYFAAEYFADPAWDMLLDLFYAQLEQRQVCVSSLCIAAATPATTALRWIATLTKAGLFVRHPDPADRRRHFLMLSKDAERAMERYFHELARRRG